MALRRPSPRPRPRGRPACPRTAGGGLAGGGGSFRRGSPRRGQIGAICAIEIGAGGTALGRPARRSRGALAWPRDPGMFRSP